MTKSETPFFVVGCPRSGTTLLRNLLRSHPRLTIPGESHFIPRFFKVFGHPASDKQAEQLAKRILASHWIKNWRLELTPKDFKSCRSFQQVVHTLYAAFCAREKKPRWGDKTPQYVLDIPILLELYPDAKFIHCVRDGRDIALSLKKISFGPNNVYEAAKYWRLYVEKGLEAGARLPSEQFLTVHYEKLISNVSESMKRVCEFLGEPYDESVLQPTPYRGNTSRRLLGKTTDTHMKKIVISENFNKWQSLMSFRQQGIFLAIAGDLLKSLGYNAAGPEISLSFPERVWYRVSGSVLWVWKKINNTKLFSWLWTDFYLRWIELRYRLKTAK